MRCQLPDTKKCFKGLFTLGKDGSESDKDKKNNRQISKKMFALTFAFPECEHSLRLQWRRRSYLSSTSFPSWSTQRIFLVLSPSSARYSLTCRRRFPLIMLHSVHLPILYLKFLCLLFLHRDERAHCLLSETPVQFLPPPLGSASIVL